MKKKISSKSDSQNVQWGKLALLIASILTLSIHNSFASENCKLSHDFLCVPIKKARLSSGFGKRSHPVLGHIKMHKGVDFAAPTGTPILAAGNGVVVKASRLGSYGNYILIRHNGRYQTAYAHLKKFAPGVRPGSSVRQGQVIGYVGTTGRSTGPHLHFELIENGKHIKP